MLGLSRDIVEYRLPIKKGFRPHKQLARRFAPDVIGKVKEKIERLLKAKFIETARYVEWLSNIVPVKKKNGKLRVCIILKKVNVATIRDHYPLPITNHMIERVAGVKAYSFLDGFSGYNQISIDP